LDAGIPPPWPLAHRHLLWAELPYVDLPCTNVEDADAVFPGAIYVVDQQLYSHLDQLGLDNGLSAGSSVRVGAGKSIPYVCLSTAAVHLDDLELDDPLVELESPAVAQLCKMCYEHQIHVNGNIGLQLDSDVYASARLWMAAD
jgi:hypothetical protein